ncbi:hypothetical protein NHF40_08815 [Maricaulaceae bacterium EIL42A08]|nr:hypothetical protein [Maricaulaceae bacterium EIL42A08]
MSKRLLAGLVSMLVAACISTEARQLSTAERANERSLEAYQQENFDLALEYASEACSGGIAEACGRTAYIYEMRALDGRHCWQGRCGMTVMYEFAATYWKEACTLGSGMGCSWSARYHRRDDPSLALYFAQAGCSLDSASSCEMLEVLTAENAGPPEAARSTALPHPD